MIVAFDTETRGFDYTKPDERAFLASWATEAEPHGRAADLTLYAETEAFIEALRAATIIVAHNLPFDVHHVREALGIDILDLGVPLFDTQVMSQVEDPGRVFGRGGHKLKTLSVDLLADDANAEQEEMREAARDAGLGTLNATGAYYALYLHNPDLVRRYARKDAAITLALFKLLRERIAADPGLTKALDLERAIQPILIRAEQRGVALDREKARELHTRFGNEAREARDRAETALGEQALGGEGSEAALLDALQSQGVPLYRKTEKSGELATNVFALQEFEDDYPAVADLLAYRRAEKILSTYTGPMQDRAVVHTSFMQCQARTSRMASMRPNMQNLPKRAGEELRSMFVPREGHCFAVCDYESIEVRFLAYYLGSYGESYRDLIKAGLDPHAFMAAQIWGGEPEDYGKGTSGEKQRAVAKNTMFAIVYGAGGRRVADMNQITEPQARKLIKSIKAGLPGFYELQKRIRAGVEERGFVRTILGRRVPVSIDKHYVGLNAVIQGSAAEVIKLALARTAPAIAPLGAHILLVVHDELLAETPIEHAPECLSIMKHEMRSAYDLDPPLEVSGDLYADYSGTPLS